MRRLSETELAIAKMETLEAVRFYNLMDAVHNGREGQMLALMVLYGDGRYFNCTQSDPEFDFLLRKALDLYHLEKDRREIDMDHLSRRMLEEGRVDIQRSLAAFYQGKHAYDEPLLDYAETRFPEIRDIVYDQLRILHGLRGETLTILGYSGHKGKIAVRAALEDGTERIIPLTVRRESGFSHRVSMGNLLGGIGGVKLAVDFGNNRISVRWHTDDRRLRMEARYRVSDRGLHVHEEVYTDGELRHQRIGDAAEPVGGGERSALLRRLRLDGDPKDAEPDFYRLPWGGYYAHATSRLPLGDRCVQYTGDSVYILPCEEYVILRQYGEKGLSAPDDGFYIDTDGVMKSVNIHFIGGFGVMETTFGYTSGALGSYKRELAGKSFYHLFPRDRPEDLRPVTAADGIVRGYQLLDGEALEYIWKGRAKLGGII